MSTKLEALVEVLKGANIEEEIINDVIVDYFGDQHNEEFNVDGDTYIVLNEREMEDKLYQSAENKYFDAMDELEKSTYRTQNSFIAGQILKFVAEEDAVESIAKDLDYEEEYDTTFIGESFPYKVYRLN